MLLSMLLARCGHVIGRMAHLAMRHMGMVPGGFVVAGFMLFGGFLVVIPSCMAATRRGLMVLFGLPISCHIGLLWCLPSGWLAILGRIRCGQITFFGHFFCKIDLTACWKLF
jgi:hypothetical protein